MDVRFALKTKQHNVLGNLSIDNTITPKTLVVNGSTTGLNKSAVLSTNPSPTEDLFTPVVEPLTIKLFGVIILSFDKLPPIFVVWFLKQSCQP